MSSLLQKILVLVITFLFVTFSSSEEVFWAFILLGHGHFLIAYLYQWKGGKITKGYKLAYIPFALIFFALVFNTNDILWLSLLTGLVFSLHFFYDELRLTEQSGKLTDVNAIPILIPTAVYMATLIEGLTSKDIFLYVYVLIAAVFVMGVFWKNDRKALLESMSVALHLFALALIALHYSPYSISMEKLFGFIVIFHYLSWYLYYYIRLQDMGPKLVEYVKAVVGLNLLVIVLFYIYWSADDSVLKFLFDPKFFYMWATIHIVFSGTYLIDQLQAFSKR
jgi:hypothetical protein